MTRSGLRRFIITIVSGAALACASGGAPDTAGGDPAPRRDRTLITAADMRELTVSNLLEVVQRLHPEWLTPRNGASPGQTRGRGGSSTEVAVQVYIDVQHAGNSDVLGQLSVTSASSLKYYSASEAQARFGNGNIYGAIQVVTTKR